MLYIWLPENNVVLGRALVWGSSEAENVMYKHDPQRLCEHGAAAEAQAGGGLNKPLLATKSKTVCPAL